MTDQPPTHLRFWLVTAVIALLTIWLLRSMLLPFVAGMAVAYFLDPAADRMQRWGISRSAATAVIVFGFFAIVALGLIQLVPALIDQFDGFVQRLPGYIETLRNVMLPHIRRLISLADQAGGQDVKAALGGLAERAANMAGSLLNGVLGGGLFLIDLVSLAVITPVVAFYLLRDWDLIVDKVDSWLPRRHAETIRAQAREVDRVLAGFVRGQSLVCLSLSLFYGIGLSLAGLQFGLVIGIISGVLTFIPYVGTIFGFVASVGIALVQFWPDYTMIGVIAAIYVIGQMIEGYVLVPKLVGEKVGLHPVWVIFGLMAGGALFGFVGVLIAVPIVAVVGVAIRFGLMRYLASSFYRDADETSPPLP